ncbi:hypothetical protein DD876_13345, partial [Staphylococcus pseudintermedius]|uniref:hypothetical protein n=1 Tax=Staphylococcus pseudintermedius TaxID=283734 RepID=UPI000D949D66
TEAERLGIEVIIIDAAKDRRGIDYSDYFKSKYVLWQSPKPNVYQGKERKTKTEMFSPSNARNTGILVS